jgi:tRNA nucleotidyltransferase/poly(A) polymerase
MDFLNKAAFTAKMNMIVEFLQDLGAFKFVGGCVRDILRETEPHDYDLITPFTPDEVEAFLVSKVGKKKVYTVGKRYGTLGVLVNGEKIEITTYRGEDYTGKKCFTCGFLTMKAKCPNVREDTGTVCGSDTYATRKPEVQYTKNLDEDLKRRDFTINAIAIDPYSGKIHDPFHGQTDIALNVIRAVGNPKQRFKEDPLRILRAVRFAARFKAGIAVETFEYVKKMRYELQRVSKERVITEISSMMRLEPLSVADALKLMFDTELWQVILPELQMQYMYDQKNPHHTLKLHEHSLVAAMRTAEWWDRAVTLNGVDTPPEASREAHVWAALLHDVAKPFTQREKEKIPGEYNYLDHDRLGAMMAERFMQYWKFSNDDTEFVVTTIRDHLQDGCWLRPFDNGAK